MNETFIEQQRAVLTAVVDRLSGTNLKRNIREQEGHNSSDFGDMSTAASTLDNVMSLVSNTSKTLGEAARALRKIEQGTYGVCELTGEPISQERLEAIPWARYTIEAQRSMETNGRTHRSAAPAELFGDSQEPEEELEEQDDK